MMAVFSSKKDAYVKFYDAPRSLHMESDASGISLRAGLLQVRNGMTCGSDKGPNNATQPLIAFVSKSLLITQCYCNNMECEALGMLHGLEKFHHSCFARKYGS